MVYSMIIVFWLQRLHNILVYNRRVTGKVGRLSYVKVSRFQEIPTEYAIFKIQNSDVKGKLSPVFSMILKISKTHIDQRKLNNNGFIL